MEIGPDVGLFVENCVRAGNFDHYWLFEPNRAVAPALEQVVKARNFSIVHDMFDHAPVPEASVGAAVMIHVLDHLLDPMETLRSVKQKLVVGGKILVVTHDESSLLRRVFGQRFPPFCLQHPQLYNPTSVRAMLEAAGYQDVRVQRSSNYFPVHFLVKQFLWACGLRVSRVPQFWSWSIRLRLGNILAVASA
jgi:Methyltransferase domain